MCDSKHTYNNKAVTKTTVFVTCDVKYTAIGLFKTATLRQALVLTTGASNLNPESSPLSTLGVCASVLVKHGRTIVLDASVIPNKYPVPFTNPMLGVWSIRATWVEIVGSGVFVIPKSTSLFGRSVLTSVLTGISFKQVTFCTMLSFRTDVDVASNHQAR